MNWKRATLTLMLLGSTVGCTRWELSLRRESWDVELRGMSQAAMQRYASVDPRLTDSDFAGGWKAGYENVLRGGAGDPPIVPPKQYLSPASRREGQAHKANAWHDGFIAGAAAARDSGMDSYSNLPTGLPRSEAMLGSPFYTADLPNPSNGTVNSPTSTMLPAPLPPVFRHQVTDEQTLESQSVLTPAPRSETQRVVPDASPESLKPSEKPDVESPSASDRSANDRPQTLPKPMDRNSPAKDATEPSDSAADALQPETVTPIVSPISARSMIQDRVTQDRVTLFPVLQSSPDETFETLNQSAGELRASGWTVPLPPARDGRVAESVDASMRPLSPWR